MALFEPKELCEIVRVENSGPHQSLFEKHPSGILMISEESKDSKKLTMPADFGDFAKWIRSNKANIKVEIQKAEQIQDLHSDELWLPLVILANDISLPIYLNLVANYLYDKMKGALKGDRTQVHFSAIYQDEQAGIFKQFNYVGEAETLKKLSEETNLDRFFK